MNIFNTTAKNADKTAAQPTIITIADIIDEGEIELSSKDFKTFIFDYKLLAKPGQYVMLWLPGVDLKPFSVAWQTAKQFGLIALKVGPYTQKLFKLEKGDKVGIMGPYGNNYDLADKKKILIIGGGSGVASVIFLAQEAKNQKIEVDFVLAAKTEDKIIYENWLAEKGVKIHHRFQNKKSRTTLSNGKVVSGKYERAWDLIEDLVSQNSYDGIYACGPELLLKQVVDLSLEKNIFCQVSLERYMKCGIGVCGQCCVDPFGVCLCEVGPVVDNQFASKITEFGKYHRDATGQKIDFHS